MIDPEELAEFVKQSNAIEGIYVEAGDPLFDHHLEIATTIAHNAGDVITPRGIHVVLMRSQPTIFPGEYRQVGVRVGNDVKMNAVEVRKHMPVLLALAKVVREMDQDPDEPHPIEGLCWEMHHHFEWIHPFIDGNGRTGRLWMNSLRLAYGLDWLTVQERDRQTYYDSIRSWEAKNGITLK